MKRILLPVLGAGLLLLSACGTEDGGPGTISTTAPILPGVNGVEALYAPSSDPAVPSILPVPNNAALGLDGTINLKDSYGNPYTDITTPQGAINTLDGFSTVGPMTTSFGEELDAATVPQAVHVFDALGTKLVFGVDYVALPNPADKTVLVIKPLKALKGSMNYLVAVTNDLKGISGKPTAPSRIFNLMKSAVPLVDAAGVSQVPGVPDANAAGLEALRSTVTPVLTVAAANQIPKDKIVVAWSFKTQTIGKVLAAVQAASSSNVAVTDFYSNLVLPAATFAAANGLPLAAVANIGSVVVGTARLPYYLDTQTAANPLGPIRGTFTIADPANPLPTLKSTQAVPYLLSVPAGAGPWPVVIFQHGFTVDKSAMFGVANTLAQFGFATIGIDAVLHGDRTFGIDYVNNTTGAPGPDGVADTSGKHYLNLGSLLTSRDNIRQSVADLIHLTRLLEIQTLDVVNNTTGAPGADLIPDLTPTGFKYVGHSNGGILGTVFMAVEPAVTRAALVNAGGDYASILQASGAFSPVVNAGLAAADPEVIPGSPKYNSFFFAAQTAVDDGDPLNYAAAAAAKSIFLLKTTPDGVVPNAQTDALALNLGLPQVSGNGVAGTLASPQAVNGFINYTTGTHSSFLLPDAATAAMQTDVGNFLLTGSIATSNITVTE